ncbi:Signal peptidase complex subunit 2 [Clydaea vesicula]|uniref:Signal peptidase complex subunit 2 n=1 Tax=Clydaea vesicula TaxID=447962 RepID=A0AAD5U5S9_9FUNG|nr:Signal peptidase complex subunit 2 [Clydaea vesicula]KAJ3396855.1 Signal peptidase complex subunit 2 [Lobulomyces angularis]
MSKSLSSKNKMNSTTSSKFLQLYETTPVTAEKWCHGDYKRGVDEAIKNLLTLDLGYTQDNFLKDAYLALGYIACSFALYGTYICYYVQMPFQESKPTLYVCVSGYFFFSFLMQLFSWFVEKNIIFQGFNKELNEKIVIESKSSKFSDKITFTITRNKSIMTTTSFGKWFDKNGVFSAADFKDDFGIYVTMDETKNKKNQ